MDDIKQMAQTFNAVSEAAGLEPVFTTDADDAAEREHNAREDYWYAHPEARE